MPLHNDTDAASSLDRKHMPVGLDALYNWLNGTMNVTLKNGVPQTVGFKHYKSAYTTSGNGTGDTAAIGVAPACEIGQRKLITLATKTAAGDKVTLDFASFSYGTKTVSAVVLTNANDFVFAEWRGQKWEILGAATGVVTAA